MAELTNRERFVRLSSCESVDRVPFWDIMGFWPSTLVRWKTEGLAADATADTVREMIGFEGTRGHRLRVNAFVWPHFDLATVGEESGRYLPGLDHGVPSAVSWDNYRYFFDQLCELICKYPPA